MNIVFNRKLLQCQDAHGVDIKSDIVISDGFEQTYYIIRIKDLFSGCEELTILLKTDLELNFLPLLYFQEESNLLITGLQNRVLFIDTKKKAVAHDIYLDFPLFYVYYIKENDSFIFVTECEILNYSRNGEVLHSCFAHDVITGTKIENNQLSLKTDSSKVVIDLVSWAIK